MKKECAEQSEFSLSNVFLKNLEKLSAAGSKLTMSKLRKNHMENNELKVHPPDIEKITEAIYLNNDDIIKIINNKYFTYNHYYKK